MKKTKLDLRLIEALKELAWTGWQSYHLTVHDWEITIKRIK